MLSKFLEISAQPLYVQPRMGFASLNDMKQGLQAVKEIPGPTIGTLTLDSYTRMEKYDDAAKALKSGASLNGFPILAYTSEQIQDHITCLQDASFPLQVRHGTAKPQKIIAHLLNCRLFLTEGGPISYCLPYSRVPLREAIQAWEEACHLLAAYPEQSHLESFAGCLLGQLCHPSLLIALNILEGLFFQTHGLKDISLSYAQQYNLTQDVAAVNALQTLGHLYLSPTLSWHVVIYTFMGLFPQTSQGHARILRESVQLARLSQSSRLIVKTQDESVHIPSVASNLDALRQAQRWAQEGNLPFTKDQEEEDLILMQAQQIIESVLDLDHNINKALLTAFKRGFLDIPYCLHPDNGRRTRCGLDNKGYLQWIDIGHLPFKLKAYQKNRCPALTSQQLLKMLAFNRSRFDA